MKACLILFVVTCLMGIFQTDASPQVTHTLVKRGEPFGLPSPFLRTACRGFALFACPEWDSFFSTTKGVEKDKGSESDAKEGAAKEDAGDAAAPAEAAEAPPAE